MTRLVLKQLCWQVAISIGLGLVATVLAQTPFDAHTIAFGSFIRNNLGPLLVMLLIIAGFLSMALAYHSPGLAIIGLGVLMVMIIGISSALNGTAITWLGLTPVP